MLETCLRYLISKMGLFWDGCKEPKESNNNHVNLRGPFPECVWEIRPGGEKRPSLSLQNRLCLRGNVALMGPWALENSHRNTFEPLPFDLNATQLTACHPKGQNLCKANPELPAEALAGWEPFSEKSQENSAEKKNSLNSLMEGNSADVGGWEPKKMKTKTMKTKTCHASHVNKGCNKKMP